MFLMFGDAVTHDEAASMLYSLRRSYTKRMLATYSDRERQAIKWLLEGLEDDIHRLFIVTSAARKAA